VGQNSYYGAPNKLTGNRSMYGEIHAFSTKEKREKYMTDYFYYDVDVIEKKCTRKTARNYCLGSTAQEFRDYMDSVDCDVDQEYNRAFDIEDSAESKAEMQDFYDEFNGNY
jgi:hypothetical protein